MLYFCQQLAIIKLAAELYSLFLDVLVINKEKSVRGIYSDIFPTRCDITQFIYFWKTALHVSGGISTHHQEHTQLYLQHLVLVKLLLLPAAIVEELELRSTACRYSGRVETVFQFFHDSGRQQ